MTPPAPAHLHEKRRQRVHESVRELLSEQGFRVSMEAVALRAGCSKQTLYSMFGSKQELMRSMLQEHLEVSTAWLAADSSDLRADLVSFATEHLQRLSDPSVVAACQLLGAEALQFPEEAQALYQEGCHAMQQRLASWLQAAMLRGELEEDPPALAAELLLSMLVGTDHERQRLAVPHRDTAEARAAWIAFAVDRFLRAYAPRTGPGRDPGHPPDR